MARAPITRGVTMPTAAAGTSPEDPEAILAAMEGNATPPADDQNTTEDGPVPSASPQAPVVVAGPVEAFTITVPPIADRTIADRSGQRSPQRSEERSPDGEQELAELRAYRARMERQRQGLPQHPRHQDNTKLQAEIEQWAHRALRTLHGDAAATGMGFGKLVTSLLEDGLRARDPDLAARVYAARAAELGADDDWTRERDPIALSGDTRARVAWTAARTGHTPSGLVEAVLSHWLDTQGVPDLGAQV